MNQDTAGQTTSSGQADISTPNGQKPAGSAEAAGKSTAIFVKVYAPSKVYFEGEALSISAESATGPFDILPRHHNFITLLVPCNVVVRTATHEETIHIQGGVMHVKADSVVVFLDI